MVTVTLTEGRAARFPVAFTVIACAAVVIGLYHGWLAWRFNRVLIVASIATAGVLQVLMAWLSVSNPSGFAPVELAKLLTIGASPVLWIGSSCVLIMALCFHFWSAAKSPRRNAPLAVSYLESSICVAAFGVAAALFAEQYHAGLGDSWLNPVLVGIAWGESRFAAGLEHMWASSEAFSCSRPSTQRLSLPGSVRQSAESAAPKY